MGVVRAEIQTVEDIYRLVWTACEQAEADRSQLSWTASAVLPSPIGPQSAQENCACCATNMAEKARADWSRAGSPANWRCVALEKLSQVRLLRRFLAHRAQSFPPGILRCRRRYRRRGSAGARPTEGTVRQLREQVAGQSSFCSVAIECGLCRSGRTRRAARPEVWRRLRGLIIQHCRRGLRGKNGSARSPGTHKPRCTRWRDGESRASRVLRSGPIPTPA